jgi:hypothetical protein
MGYYFVKQMYVRNGTKYKLEINLHSDLGEQITLILHHCVDHGVSSKFLHLDKIVTEFI